jgi:hypothetical protein
MCRASFGCRSGALGRVLQLQGYRGPSPPRHTLTSVYVAVTLYIAAGMTVTWATLCGLCDRAGKGKASWLEVVARSCSWGSLGAAVVNATRPAALCPSRPHMNAHATGTLEPSDEVPCRVSSPLPKLLGEPPGRRGGGHGPGGWQWVHSYQPGPVLTAQSASTAGRCHFPGCNSSGRVPWARYTSG